MVLERLAPASRPDAFLRLCPSRAVMARIGEKWTALSLAALKDGPMRFGALMRRLDGVSQKMLSQTLRNLERDGLITRHVHDERPLRVDYELTDRGADLVPIILALKAWAERHLHDIQRSQTAAAATPGKG
ncbi:MAG: winged helix-turn-helix transcriptional regulator [Labrys sp. (in: a-proteobacteria)]|jgi:DNA-binding HxlR family transcriptional regulator